MNRAVIIEAAKAALAVMALVLLAACWLYVIHGYRTADNSGWRTREQLKSEISSFRNSIGGGNFSYISKGVLNGVSVSLPSTTAPKTLASRFDMLAKQFGWTRVEYGREPPYQTESRKFCKDRTSLILEIVADRHPYAEYGVYWTGDRNSLMYCPSTEAPKPG